MFKINIEIDHAAYPERLQGKTREELMGIMKDADQARTANPQGPKAGYYADEISYAGAELRRRDEREGQ